MKIVLSGYYGFDNAGDEALLTAITSSLRTIQPTINFTVLSGNPRRTSALHAIRAVSRVNPWTLMQELRRADLLISGGGSLLQDVTGPLSIPYYLGVVVLAKLLGTPAVFYAQGIGPVNSWLGRTLIRLVANHVDLITLRDQDSARLLKEMGVSQSPIVTADPVFSMRPTRDEIARGADYLWSLGINKDQPVIGISLRSWELEARPRLAHLFDQLVGMGYCLLFLPLQYPDDLHEAKKTMALMKEPGILVEKPMNSTELMGIITHLRVLVGMRLHSLIFSACVGIPFEGISS